MREENYFGKGAGVERAKGVIIINGVIDELKERNICGRERELHGRRNGEIHSRGKKNKLKNGGRIETREKREEQNMKKGHLDGWMSR